MLPTRRSRSSHPRTSALRWLLLAAAFGLLVAGCERPRSPASLPRQPAHSYPLHNGEAVRNIIYMIGDGMGMGQIVAARMRAHGADGQLALDRMPVLGHITTYSSDELVTDSAAAGTALSTGLKTANRRIAVTPDGQVAYSILEAARDRGLATGLVVTSTITHATPAVFAAHHNNRRDEMTIAIQMLDSGVDVLLGGGRRYFLPESEPGGARVDGRNLLEEARQKGYTIVADAAALAQARGPRLLGLFADAGMTTVSPEPSLAAMAGRALELLSARQRDFFLMIEGSQIDWGGHQNNPDYAIRETLLFDEAVRTAVEFARHDGHTLVVVTADHETGGMAINDGTLDGSRLDIGWTTRKHTGVDVPVFAFGPRAVDFTGVYDNTRIPRLFAEYLGVPDFPRVLPDAPAMDIGMDEPSAIDEDDR
ncbi:MAG: alkaline phosphatase [Chromatiales bacterium]